jgi:hypothetical protein
MTLFATEVGGLAGYATERLVGRLRGLTDAEYLWEPVGGCWTVRPDDGGRWWADLGPHGTTVPAAGPPPVTTIAWRLWHLGASPNPTWPFRGVETPAELAEGWFRQPRATTSEAVGTAGAACRLVEENWRRFCRLLGGFDDASLGEKIGRGGGPFEDSTVGALVLHIVDELIHHSAEVALLRDLYRAEPAGSR